MKMKKEEREEKKGEEKGEEEEEEEEQEEESMTMTNVDSLLLCQSPCKTVSMNYLISYTHMCTHTHTLHQMLYTSLVYR
jgi:hypothetical protein